MHIVNIWNNKSRTLKNRQAYKKTVKIKKKISYETIFFTKFFKMYSIYFIRKNIISIIELKKNKCVQNKKIFIFYFCPIKDNSFGD